MAPPAPQQRKLAKGEFLFLQGDPSPDFYVLTSGKVEILSTEDLDTPTREEVELHGRRIALLEESSAPIGELGALQGVPRGASVRAVADSVLVRVPTSGRVFRQWLVSNLKAALALARALVRRYERTLDRWRSLRQLERRVHCMIENFSLAYAYLSKEEVRSPDDARAAAAAVMDGNLDEPAAPPYSLVEGDFEERGDPSEVRTIYGIDEELVRFLDRLLRGADETLQWLTDGDAFPLLFVTERLAESFPTLNDRTRAAVRNCEKALLELSGNSNSLVASFRSLWEELSAERRSEAMPFYRRLVSVSREMSDVVTDLWGRELPGFNPDLAALEAALGGVPVAEQSVAKMEEAAAAAAPAPPQAGSEEKAEEPPKKAPRGKAGSLNLHDALLAVPGVTEELMREYRESASRVPQEGASKTATAAFWKIYTHTVRALMSEERKDWLLFVRYGLMGKDSVLLRELGPLDPAEHKPGPVRFMDEWLRGIHKGDVTPSRNELGLTYEEVIRAGGTGRYAEDESDAAFDMVRFEIDNVLAPAARASSGGATAPPPGLSLEADFYSLKERAVTPSAIALAVVKLLKVDFTAFFREVRVLVGERSDFVQKEILPYFILLPVVGERALAWQEYDGRAKSTPGRILFPVQAQGVDLYEMMVDSVAKFRWELCRSIVGPAANDPVQGGMVGVYSDYVQFFKKNPELTEDQREKLKSLWGSARSNRDRFALEYKLWVMYESQGIQKLNRVARRIFTEQIPFPLDLRKQLAKHPAFVDLFYRDSNRRTKKRQEVENRMHKLAKDGVEVGNAFDDSLRMFEPMPQ